MRNIKYNTHAWMTNIIHFEVVCIEFTCQIKCQIYFTAQASKDDEDFSRSMREFSKNIFHSEFMQHERMSLCNNMIYQIN